MCHKLNICGIIIHLNLKDITMNKLEKLKKHIKLLEREIGKRKLILQIKTDLRIMECSTQEEKQILENMNKDLLCLKREAKRLINKNK